MPQNAHFMRFRFTGDIYDTACSLIDWLISILLIMSQSCVKSTEIRTPFSALCVIWSRLHDKAVHSHCRQITDDTESIIRIKGSHEKDLAFPKVQNRPNDEILSRIINTWWMLLLPLQPKRVLHVFACLWWFELFNNFFS